jgi:hypothetical protein
MRGQPCKNPAKVQGADGNWYCAVHHEAAVKLRNEERNQRWDREWKAKQRQWAIDTQRIVVADAALEWSKSREGDERTTDELVMECQKLRELMEGK